jgi:thiol-disulfide isomerase/thioredoxin
MWARLAIVFGLLAGIAVAGLAIGAILAFAPIASPGASQTPVPSFAFASPSPSPTLAPTPTPAPSVAPSGSAGASPSVGASASGSTAPGASSSAGAALFHVGEAAPPLVVAQVGGGTIDLAKLKGKPVWVNFMGTYCPPCQDEFPLMNGFAARYQDTGLVILAIDVKEDEGTVGSFATLMNAVFPMGLDSDGAYAAAWDASAALPMHFWIDKDGVIRYGAAGGIGPDVMAAGLQTILPGVTVTP